MSSDDSNYDSEEEYEVDYDNHVKRGADDGDDDTFIEEEKEKQ